jgi:hypothetical protein
MTASDPAIRRHLRDLDDEHRATAPRWRDLLLRVFGGDEPLTTADKAALLGVPTRRQILRVGGIGLAGAAVLAACSEDDLGDQPPSTAPVDERDDDDEVIEDEGRDMVLANTAISLEVLVIDTYRFVLDSELLPTAVLREAVELFGQHHAEHRDALVAVVEAAGEEPFTTANPVVKAATVDPLLLAAASEGDVVRLAHDLELSAAQTYVHAAAALSTAELRATAVRIAGVESRHASVLDAVGQLSNSKPATYPAVNPLPIEAMVTG